MLFQVLCGFEPVFYTTHPNEEPIIDGVWIGDIELMQPFEKDVYCGDSISYQTIDG